MSFEKQYLKLGIDILKKGEEVQGRNGITKQLFATQLKFDLQKEFPILTTRKSFYKMILGEYAALMNAPFNNVQHMKDFGVNYWDLWADKTTGKLNIDYGNEGERILNESGITQMSEIVRMLKEDKHSRRIILNYWNADHVYSKDNPLSLHNCWYSLQFHVRKDKYLDIIWNQRSADLALGVQADAILASMFAIVIGNQVGLKPGIITMNLGNTHLYKEHWDKFAEQATYIPLKSPKWKLKAKKKMAYKDFRPDMLELIDYKHLEPIKYELKE
jgi:thymidylate synthase